VTVLVSAVPVAVFACGTGLWTLQRDSLRQHKPPVTRSVADLLPELGTYAWPASLPAAEPPAEYRPSDWPAAELLWQLGTYEWPAPAEPAPQAVEEPVEIPRPGEPATPRLTVAGGSVHHLVEPEPGGKPWEDMSDDEIRLMIAAYPTRRKLAQALDVTPYRAQALIDQHAN
jgi:hypothetical protein